MATLGSITLTGGLTITSPPPSFTISPAVSGKSVWVPSVDGALDLNTTGQWTIVPNSTFNIQAKIWGSGGGSYRRCGACALGPGGAGGAATGTIQLDNGTSYILVVGGTGDPDSGAAGSGGGYSGIFTTSKTQANARIMAGGGGECGFQGCGGPFGCEGGEAGGAGGGTTGQDAGPGGGTVSGTALQGGGGTSYSGGGGGGYWGGGGGSRATVSNGPVISGTGGSQTAGGTRADGTQGTSGGGGGGGSGFLHSSIINGTLYTGSGTTPGNSGDPNRGNAGGTTTSTGQPGKIYLYL